MGLKPLAKEAEDLGVDSAESSY